MIPTDTFKRQQSDILDLAKRISERLDEGPLTAQVDEILFMLRGLKDKVTIHLAAEDQLLFPRLERNTSDELAFMARQFRGELATLCQDIADFTARWDDKNIILVQPSRFLRETGGLLAVLGHSLERERVRLYPLLVTVQWPSRATSSGGNVTVLSSVA